MPASVPMLLNKDQQEAVLMVDRHVLVLAGAGSGKTRVITAKLFYLIRTVGLPPYKLLALTFTNKAAGEMRSRVGSLLGLEYRDFRTLVLTFHAFGVHFLRLFLHLFPKRSNNFVICDDQQKKSFLKEILKERQLDLQELKEVSRFISLCKNKLVLSEASDLDNKVDQFFYFKLKSKKHNFIQIYKAYEELLIATNRVDFDDLIVLTLRLIREQASVREYITKRWQHLLIDEYQDTDFAQEKIIEAFAKLGVKITAVGDDNQSIYGFRGAEIMNILSFPQKYPNAHRVILEENYRSTAPILDMANEVIAKNPKQFKKKLRAQEGFTGKRPVYRLFNSDHEEAVWVVENIVRLKSEGMSLSEMAVFYRTNYQSRVMEEALVRARIHYRVARGFRFYERKEIREVLAYLSFLLNLKDRPAFVACINVPKRAIGENTVQMIQTFINEHPEYNILECLAQEDLRQQVSKRASQSLIGFYEFISECRAMLEREEPLATVVEKVIHKSGLWAFYEKIVDSFERDQRTGSLRQFIRSIADFTEEFEGSQGFSLLENFLENVSLAGSEQPQTDSEQAAVNLLAVHNAKGLEYTIVHVIGMEDSVFPHYLSLGSNGEVEEERRLFYVAVTRAMRGLFLSSASMKHMRGKLDFFKPSRFLKELPETCFAEESSSLKDEI